MYVRAALILFSPLLGLLAMVCVAVWLSGCVNDPSLLTIKSPSGETQRVTVHEMAGRVDLARLCRQLAVQREEITTHRAADPDPENQQTYDAVLHGIDERLAFCRSQGAL